MISYIPIQTIFDFTDTFIWSHKLWILLCLLSIAILILLYNFVKDEINLIKNRINKKNISDFCWFNFFSTDFKGMILQKNLSFGTFLSINIAYIINSIPALILLTFFIGVSIALIYMFFLMISTIINGIIFILNIMLDYSQISFVILLVIASLIIIKYVLYRKLRENRKK